MDKLMGTDDMFMRAAHRYCERVGKDPLQPYDSGWSTRADAERKRLSDLCESILALKDVGALQ